MRRPAEPRRSRAALVLLAALVTLALLPSAPAGAATGSRPPHPATYSASAVGDGGYRLAGADGSVYSFGASYTGSLTGLHLAAPVVGLASTPRFGYWLVAADGGVFSFGDARFHGSTGNLHLAAPVVGMASTPSGHGYWLVAADGGIFSFGDARFHGSTGALTLRQPVVGMAATPSGGGYWLAAADGGIFSFGDARFRGSAATAVRPAPVVGISASRRLNPYQPGTTGYDISWPQCGGAYPPAPHEVTVVGVNGGRMYTKNPCLASEAAWAGPTLTLYVNVDGLPADTTSGLTGPAGRCSVGDVACRSYNYGWNAAQFDVATAADAGVSSTMWWLDVEIGKPWRADTASNVQVIEGVLDGLRRYGSVVGVYSTSYQFGVIAGSAYFPGVPLWVPGARSAVEAVSFCDPSHAFGGGVTWLTQWTETFDHDYACPT